MIKAIIFDWSGVLDKINFFGLKDRVSKYGSKSSEQVISLIKRIEIKWRTGMLDPKIFWKKLQKTLNLTDDQLSKCQKYFLKVDKNDDLWRIILHLRNKYTLAILSDLPTDKVKIVRKNVDLSFFKIANFSAEQHELKENLFLKTANALEKKSENCLFVDETKDNIEKALKLGFKTCHFKSIADLKKALAAI